MSELPSLFLPKIDVAVLSASGVLVPFAHLTLVHTAYLCNATQLPDSSAVQEDILVGSSGSYCLFINHSALFDSCVIHGN